MVFQKNVVLSTISALDFDHLRTSKLEDSQNLNQVKTFEWKKKHPGQYQRFTSDDSGAAKFRGSYEIDLRKRTIEVNKPCRNIFSKKELELLQNIGLEFGKDTHFQSDSSFCLDQGMACGGEANLTGQPQQPESQLVPNLRGSK